MTEIEHINGLYFEGNLTELELLRLVWDRINHPINSSNVDSLKKNLIDQLADCKNGDSLYCCEGRVMRILQTLEECDNENIVNLRPMWAYRDEIVQKIEKYQKKLFRIVPPAYKS